MPEEQRSAKFVSAVCFMLPDGRALEVEGECPGRIAFTLQNGDYGFGYDPLFIPDEYGAPDGKRPNTERRSYAQLTPDEKDAISIAAGRWRSWQKSCPNFWDKTPSPLGEGGRGPARGRMRGSLAAGT